LCIGDARNAIDSANEIESSTGCTNLKKLTSGYHLVSSLKMDSQYSQKQRIAWARFVPSAIVKAQAPAQSLSMIVGPTSSTLIFHRLSPM
jgi:hypothetical protein